MLLDICKTSGREFSAAITIQQQEPITRSVQLTYFRATAFSQVRLFLDTPFPPKITVSGYLRIEICVNKKWRPNAVVFASVFRFPSFQSLFSFNWSSHNATRFIYNFAKRLLYISQSESTLWKFFSRLCNDQVYF